MPKYNWSKLNRQQVGSYSEYFVKMEFTMYGCQVYTTEVDDRGIDFVTRYETGPFMEIQVKSIREKGYVFMEKEKFKLKENLYLALVILNEGKLPDLFLIPAMEWHKPNQLLAGKDYEGLKSKPEWGVNLSMKNMPMLEMYRFEEMVSRLFL
ncbi:MAG: DUF4365 domain-containing protein [Fibrobacteria bacterium]|nr:DUF4365 domain-containing protein [Fibrobacteria bacterium]